MDECLSIYVFTFVLPILVLPENPTPDVYTVYILTVNTVDLF